jgi:hypothetical protein
MSDEKILALIKSGISENIVFGCVVLSTRLREEVINFFNIYGDLVSAGIVSSSISQHIISYGTECDHPRIRVVCGREGYYFCLTRNFVAIFWLPIPSSVVDSYDVTVNI